MKDNFYDKIKDNKKNFFIIAIISSLIVALPSFINATYVNKDLTFHIYRIQEMTTNIEQGIWLPALQGNNCLGYGYLVDIFYPNLFLYPAALLCLIIKNPLTSFKIMIVLYGVFTFYLAYYSASLTTEHERFSFYFALLYCLYPYRTLNFYYNGFVGEFFAYAFLPLIIFGINRLYKTGKWKMLAIGMIGILYSHLITLLLASIYILFYMIFNIKKTTLKIIKKMILTTITTVLIGAAFLIPFIQHMVSDDFKFNYNADQSGILSYGLINLPIYIEILIQIFIILLFIYLYKKLKNRFENSDLLKCYFICIYSIIAITKIFPWEICDCIPFLRNIQFSLRIIGFISPFMVFVFTEIATNMKEMNKVFIAFFISIIIFICNVSFQTMKSEDNYIPNFNEIYLEFDGYQQNTFFDVVAAEYIPIEFNLNNKNIVYLTYLDFFNANDAHFSKEVDSYELIKDNTLTTLLNLKTTEKVNVLIPLTYYINYEAYLNGEEIPVFEKNGQIYLKDISSGQIIIKYEISNTQIYSLYISIISILIIIILDFFTNKKKKSLQNIKNIL